MKKNYFSLLLALLLSMVSTSVLAYDAEIDGVYYNFFGNEASVTYKDTNYNSYSGDIVIPKSVSYNGTTYSVTGIGEWAFKGCSGLTSVTIPEGVTSIGERAFVGCSGLSSVSLYCATIGSWFKDYVYFPMGGSRRGNLCLFKNKHIQVCFQ